MLAKKRFLNAFAVHNVTRLEWILPWAEIQGIVTLTTHWSASPTMQQQQQEAKKTTSLERSLMAASEANQVGAETLVRRMSPSAPNWHRAASRPN